MREAVKYTEGTTEWQVKHFPYLGFVPILNTIQEFFPFRLRPNSSNNEVPKVNNAVYTSDDGRRHSIDLNVLKRREGSCSEKKKKKLLG
jgi:hypothetical protein